MNIFRKHILFVTKELVPYHYGGIGTLFKAQAQLLLKNGYRVSFLTRSVEGGESEKLREHYGDVEFHYVDVRDESSFVAYSPSGGVMSPYSLAYAIGVEKKYREIAEKSPPDIVICADFGGEGFFLFLKSRLLDIYQKTRFILHISGGLHEILSAYEGSNAESVTELSELKNVMDCSIEDSCIYFAPEIIAPTLSAWRLVKERLAIEKKVDIVANILDHSLFSSGQIAPDTSDKKYLLFVGRLDRVKGADIILQFFLDNHHHFGERLELKMVGRDCFWKEYGCTFLEYWCDRIPENVRGRIHFTGQVNHEHVKDYFSNATLCVFPSRLEIFGNVCLEAMSFCVPCIVARKTGLVEILGDDLGDFVFDFAKEQSDIRKAVNRIINLNGGQRNQLGDVFRNRFEEVTEGAERDFLTVIDREQDAIGKHGNLHQDEVYNRVFAAVDSLLNITYFLGNDVQQLKKYYRPDEDTYRKIVRGEVETSNSSQRPLSLFKKLIRFTDK